MSTPRIAIGILVAALFLVTYTAGDNGLSECEMSSVWGGETVCDARCGNATHTGCQDVPTQFTCEWEGENCTGYGWDGDCKQDELFCGSPGSAPGIDCTPSDGDCSTSKYREAKCEAIGDFCMVDDPDGWYEKDCSGEKDSCTDTSEPD